MSVQDINDAISLLQSIGVENLCRASNSSWHPGLPLCADAIASSSSSSYLRGSVARILQEEEPTAEAAELLLYNTLGVVFCVCGVALIAGLFLGLMTLDVLQLRILQRASRDDQEKLYARTLVPILEQKHLLLVTLLLMNTLFNETLPLFLDALVPGWAAILVSTTLIMFFGEILPSGLFTGPHQLYLGYRLAPLTKFFMIMMYPFAKPLSMILDYLVVGEDGAEGSGQAYNRAEMSALVRIQYEDSRGSFASKNKSYQKKTSSAKRYAWHTTKQEIMEKANDLGEENENDNQHQEPPPLHQTEVDLIEGALQMKTAVIMDVYTPLSHLYAIADDLVLDRKGFTGIYRMGYSRVPVYHSDSNHNEEDKTAILGFLMVRQLMLIDWDHKRQVSTLPLQQPRCVSPRMNLVDGLRLLRTQGHLMAFVCARPDLANKALQNGKPIPVEAGFMGIVTLEDIMESLLQEKIYDEFDIKDRDRAVATLQRWAATTLQGMFRRKKAKAAARREIISKQQYNPPSQHNTTTTKQLEMGSEATPLLGTGKNGHYHSV